MNHSQQQNTFILLNRTYLLKVRVDCTREPDNRQDCANQSKNKSDASRTARCSRKGREEKPVPQGAIRVVVSTTTTTRENHYILSMMHLRADVVLC